MPAPLLYFSLSLLVSFLLGGPVRAALVRYRILDQPNQRSSHVAPTPRGGGLSILIAITLACIWGEHLNLDQLAWKVSIVAWMVGAVSLVDDLRGLSAVIRIGSHCLGALILGWSAGFFSPLGATAVLAKESGVSLGFIWFLITFWIVGYTNAFNFMDGINGIAGMQAGFGAIAMVAVVGVTTQDWRSSPIVVCLAVSGAAVGFLPHNFPKARMFMGDVGSAPLGMILAFLVLWICREHGFRLLIPLTLIHANFILDTAITLARRVARGERWMDPHREHFYQRLIRSGHSHSFVTGCESVLVLILSLISILVARSGLGVQLVGLVLVILVCLTFFAYAEVTFNRRGCSAADCGSRP
jgi:UDP-GlcNAc:undecaprenyl-phosphate GlcNAc-1-phosphate transferase